MSEPQVVSTDALTDAERLHLQRRLTRIALCLVPPAAPNVEFTCPRCGTVWQTREREPGQWEWLPVFEPGACRHRRVERYEDGTIGCLDECGRLLAVRGEWDFL